MSNGLLPVYAGIAAHADPRGLGHPGRPSPEPGRAAIELAAKPEPRSGVMLEEAERSCSRQPADQVVSCSPAPASRCQSGRRRTAAGVAQGDAGGEITVKQPNNLLDRARPRSRSSRRTPGTSSPSVTRWHGRDAARALCAATATCCRALRQRPDLACSRAPAAWPLTRSLVRSPISWSHRERVRRASATGRKRQRPARPVELS
jgi:hypothetical protein